MSTSLTVPQSEVPSAEVQLVSVRQTVETVHRDACERLADDLYYARFEIAVKSRVEAGVQNDNDLRATDELLVNIMRANDAMEAFSKPATAAAFTLHRTLTGIAGEWKTRWTAMADPLKRAILKYKRDKEELARRQQAELDRAVEAERKRKEDEARAAMRSGNVAAAKAAMQEAQQIVTPIVMSAAPVLEHSSGRKPWAVEVVDPEALVKAIASGVVPLSAIKEFDLSFLKKEATKRGGLNWPGVRAYQEDKLSVRR